MWHSLLCFHRLPHLYLALSLDYRHVTGRITDSAITDSASSSSAYRCPSVSSLPPDLRPSAPAPHVTVLRSPAPAPAPPVAVRPQHQPAPPPPYGPRHCALHRPPSSPQPAPLRSPGPDPAIGSSSSKEVQPGWGGAMASSTSQHDMFLPISTSASRHSSSSFPPPSSPTALWIWHKDSASRVPRAGSLCVVASRRRRRTTGARSSGPPRRRGRFARVTKILVTIVTILIR